MRAIAAVSLAVTLWGGVARADALGLTTTEMAPPLRKYFGAPEDTGVLVAAVESASAAARAKVLVGDVIVELRGEARVTTAADLEDSAWQPTAFVVLRRHKFLVLAIPPVSATHPDARARRRAILLSDQPRTPLPPPPVVTRHTIPPSENPPSRHALRDLKDPFSTN